MVDISRIRFAYPEMIASALPAIDERNDSNSGKKIKIVYLMTSCKRKGPTKQTLYIIKNLDHSVFDPILITIYDEDPSSCMVDYLPYVSSHYLVKTSKQAIILGRYNELKRKLEELKPDIIHSVGVFPDYAISRIGKYKQVHTLRNYIWDDYPAQFGKIRGAILAWLQLSAMKRSTKAIACSSSLSKIYMERLGMKFDFIRNGVDVNQYVSATDDEKRVIREKLGLPADSFIFVCMCSFIMRKNMPFLLENYAKAFGTDERTYLLLLGDGPELRSLEKKYKDNPRIDFRGKVKIVSDFLKASDAYVSTSKSEGLPNSVMEAMAAGLPVVLSDIEQHREFFEANDRIGYLYRQGDSADLIEKLRLIRGGKAAEAGRVAYEVVRENFNAEKMSLQYQEVYKKIAGYPEKI